MPISTGNAIMSALIECLRGIPLRGGVMLIILENGRRQGPIRVTRLRTPMIRNRGLLAEMPSIRELFAARAVSETVAEMDAEIMRNLRAVMRSANADNT